MHSIIIIVSSRERLLTGILSNTVDISLAIFDCHFMFVFESVLINYEFDFSYSEREDQYTSC